MNVVTVIGDLSSDKTSENYPNVTICDACLKADNAKEEDKVVVSIDGESSSPCDWCGAEAD